jgi:hypothetical protein
MNAQLFYANSTFFSIIFLCPLKCSIYALSLVCLVKYLDPLLEHTGKGNLPLINPSMPPFPNQTLTRIKIQRKLHLSGFSTAFTVYAPIDKEGYNKMFFYQFGMLKEIWAKIYWVYFYGLIFVRVLHMTFTTRVKICRKDVYNKTLK